MLKDSLSKLLKTTAKYLNRLEQMGIFTGEDLLGYFPRKIEENSVVSEVGMIQPGEKNNLKGTLVGFETQKTKFKKTIYKSTFCLDDNSLLEVVWFNKPYELRSFSGESAAFLVGKVSFNYGTYSILNPEIHFQENVHSASVRPIYMESLPITSKWLRSKIKGLLSLSGHISTILPQQILKDERIEKKSSLIKKIHFPADFQEWKDAKRQLAFEELFVIQVRIIQQKYKRLASQIEISPLSINRSNLEDDYGKLPFRLTGDQKKSLLEIFTDFENSYPMHRLLQGDVGAGKTIVAFFSALQVLRNGKQVAILAPTEILAKQHYSGFLKFISLFEGESFGNSNLFNDSVSTELLIGSISNKDKQNIREKLATGAIGVVIGTHAILTEDTEFLDLGLAVIDEQHRFGVKQRNHLLEKNCHVLSMTATPIPRTLSLTIYGDQDLSILKEKPAGRKEIITRVVANEKNRSLCEKFIFDQIVKGHQVFWVCPLVEVSEVIEAKNVLEEFERISKIFPKARVNFLHGKMKSEEKDLIMNLFKNHEFDILVATSVIEVGVDIPNSTVMVIENSERFGLSQLHQFRGRIGRNDLQSYCFLMTGKVEDTRKDRLKAMEKSNDGFYLSEVDLSLRGAGDVYGVKQSGIPDFKCAEFGDVELMEKSRYWAERLLKKDLELVHFPLLKAEINKDVIYFQ